MIALAAAGLITAGFFLPWVEGADVLDSRSFTGFDLARLIRNFEIQADSTADVNQVRATAAALYLVPALALNAAALECLSRRLPDARPLVRVALFAAGAYALTVLSAVLLLSQLPLTRFETVVGTPAFGFLATAAGAALFLRLALRRRPEGSRFPPAV